MAAKEHRPAELFILLSLWRGQRWVSAAGFSFVRPRPDYGGQALPPYSVSLSSYFSYSERAIAREPPL
jgi:hypothetical protein